MANGKLSQIVNTIKSAVSRPTSNATNTGKSSNSSVTKPVTIPKSTKSTTTAKTTAKTPSVAPVSAPKVAAPGTKNLPSSGAINLAPTTLNQQSITAKAVNNAAKKTTAPSVATNTQKSTYSAPPTSLNQQSVTSKAINDITKPVSTSSTTKTNGSTKAQAGAAAERVKQAQKTTDWNAIENRIQSGEYSKPSYSYGHTGDIPTADYDYSINLLSNNTSRQFNSANDFIVDVESGFDKALSLMDKYQLNYATPKEREQLRTAVGQMWADCVHLKGAKEFENYKTEDGKDYLDVMANEFLKLYRGLGDYNDDYATKGLDDLDVNNADLYDLGPAYSGETYQSLSDKLAKDGQYMSRKDRRALEDVVNLAKDQYDDIVKYNNGLGIKRLYMGNESIDDFQKSLDNLDESDPQYKVKYDYLTGLIGDDKQKTYASEWSNKSVEEIDKKLAELTATAQTNKTKGITEQTTSVPVAERIKAARAEKNAAKDRKNAADKAWRDAGSPVSGELYEEMLEASKAFKEARQNLSSLQNIKNEDEMMFTDADVAEAKGLPTLSDEDVFLSPEELAMYKGLKAAREIVSANNLLNEINENLARYDQGDGKAGQRWADSAKNQLDTAEAIVETKREALKSAEGKLTENYPEDMRREKLAPYQEALDKAIAERDKKKEAYELAKEHRYDDVASRADYDEDTIKDGEESYRNFIHTITNIGNNGDAFKQAEEYGFESIGLSMDASIGNQMDSGNAAGIRFSSNYSDIAKSLGLVEDNEVKEFQDLVSAYGWEGVLPGINLSDEQTDMYYYLLDTKGLVEASDYAAHANSVANTVALNKAKGELISDMERESRYRRGEFVAKAVVNEINPVRDVVGMVNNTVSAADRINQLIKTGEVLNTDSTFTNKNKMEAMSEANNAYIGQAIDPNNIFNVPVLNTNAFQLVFQGLDAAVESATIMYLGGAVGEGAEALTGAKRILGKGTADLVRDAFIDIAYFNNVANSYIDQCFAENGEVTDSDILFAAVQGINEALSEKVSVEMFFSKNTPETIGQLVKQILLKQPFFEGSEEVATDWANMFAETVIKGENDITRGIEEYKLLGYKDDAAKEMAWKDFLKSNAESFAVAAISVLPTGVKTAKSYKNAKALGSYYNESGSRLGADIAKEFAEKAQTLDYSNVDNDVKKDLQGLAKRVLDNPNSVTDEMVGKLATLLDYADPKARQEVALSNPDVWAEVQPTLLIEGIEEEQKALGLDIEAYAKAVEANPNAFVATPVVSALNNAGLTVGEATEVQSFLGAILTGNTSVTEEAINDAVDKGALSKPKVQKAVLDFVSENVPSVVADSNIEESLATGAASASTLKSVLNTARQTAVKSRALTNARARVDAEARSNQLSKLKERAERSKTTTKNASTETLKKYFTNDQVVRNRGWIASLLQGNGNAVTEKRIENLVRTMDDNTRENVVKFFSAFAKENKDFAFSDGSITTDTDSLVKGLYDVWFYTSVQNELAKNPKVKYSSKQKKQLVSANKEIGKISENEEIEPKKIDEATTGDRYKLLGDWVTRADYIKKQVANGEDPEIANARFDLILDRIQNGEIKIGEVELAQGEQNANSGTSERAADNGGEPGASGESEASSEKSGGYSESELANGAGEILQQAGLNLSGKALINSDGLSLDEIEALNIEDDYKQTLVTAKKRGVKGVVICEGALTNIKGGAVGAEYKNGYIVLNIASKSVDWHKNFKHEMVHHFFEKLKDRPVIKRAVMKVSLEGAFWGMQDLYKAMFDKYVHLYAQAYGFMKLDENGDPVIGPDGFAVIEYTQELVDIVNEEILADLYAGIGRGMSSKVSESMAISIESVFDVLELEDWATEQWLGLEAVAREFGVESLSEDGTAFSYVNGKYEENRNDRAIWELATEIYPQLNTGNTKGKVINGYRIWITKKADGATVTIRTRSGERVDQIHYKGTDMLDTHCAFIIANAIRRDQLARETTEDTEEVEDIESVQQENEEADEATPSSSSAVDDAEAEARMRAEMGEEVEVEPEPEQEKKPKKESVKADNDVMTDEQIWQRINEMSSSINGVTVESIKEAEDTKGELVKARAERDTILNEMVEAMQNKAGKETLDEINSRLDAAKAEVVRLESIGKFSVDGLPFNVDRVSDSEVYGRLSVEDQNYLKENDATIVNGVVVSNANAELMRTDGFSKPDDYLGKYSPETFDPWKKSYLEHGGDEETATYLSQFLADVLGDDLLRDYVAHGAYTNPAEKSLGPLRKNVEYRWTFDMDATCPRSVTFNMARDELQRYAGRPLSFGESMNLLYLMKHAGGGQIMIPCVYCYVEGKRRMQSDSFLSYFSSRRKVMEAETDEEAIKYMYSHKLKQKVEEVETGDPNNPTKKQKVFEEVNGERVPVMEDTLSDAAKKVFDEWRKSAESGKAIKDMTATQAWVAWQEARNAVFNYLDVLHRDSDKALAASTLEKKVFDHFGIKNKDARAELKLFVGEWRYDKLNNRPHEYGIENNDNATDATIGGASLKEAYIAEYHLASRYASSSSSARNSDNYAPYTNELIELAEKHPEDRAYVEAMGGIRKHSSNDFRMEYLLDYLSFYADLALGGWTGHTYTKDPEFCRIFGRTGDRINMSIAMTTEIEKDEDGNYVAHVYPNTDEGMLWDDARKLADDYKDLGTMAMVTDNAQLSFALNNDWINMIIPFHRSGLPTELWYNMQAWSDYTSIQNERFYNTADKLKLINEKRKAEGKPLLAEKNKNKIDEIYAEEFKPKVIYDEKGERKRPHFFPGDTIQIGPNGEKQVIPGHHNDSARYLQLCKEYGVHPRFAGTIVTDSEGNEIDITQHPNYIKVIKETARIDSEQHPIEFNLNEYDPKLGMTPIEYAMKALKNQAGRGLNTGNPEKAHYIEKGETGGASGASIYDKILDTFKKEYLGKDRELGWVAPNLRRDAIKGDETQKAATAAAMERTGSTQIGLISGMTRAQQLAILNRDYNRIVMNGLSKKNDRVRGLENLRPEDYTPEEMSRLGELAIQAAELVGVPAESVQMFEFNSDGTVKPLAERYESLAKKQDDKDKKTEPHPVFPTTLTQMKTL